MTPEEIQKLVQDAVDAAIAHHDHRGFGSLRLPGSALQNSPQTAMTAKNTSALSTGGAAVLSASDQIVLDNMRTRINELETKFRALGLLK